MQRRQERQREFNEQQTKRRVTERNLKAQDLVTGTETIHRGGVHSDKSAHNNESKESNVRVDGRTQPESPTGKTTINLAFAKMIPSNYNYLGCDK